MFFNLLMTFSPKYYLVNMFNICNDLIEDGKGMKANVSLLTF